MKIATLSLLLLVTFSVGEACTTVRVGQGERAVMAKSLDWHLEGGAAIVNPRGLKKVAFILSEKDRPAIWISKYGSVTLNQYGREIPLSGMNEKGLAVEIMWLDSSVYPKSDERETLNELQWIQYQLDNYATVGEMVANVERVKVLNVYAKVHYMACDKTGDCATFEYVDGKMKVHHGERLSLPLLTNDTYAESVKFTKLFKEFGGLFPLPQGTGSLPRFARAAAMTKQYDVEKNGPASKYAFSILDDVSQGSYSVWNVVYQFANRSIHFRSYSKKEIKTIRTSEFDYSCRTGKVLIADYNQEKGGDVTNSFVDYTTEANLALLKASMKDVEALLPPGTIEKLAQYPQIFTCEE